MVLVEVLAAVVGSVGSVESAVESVEFEWDQMCVRARWQVRAPLYSWREWKWFREKKRLLGKKKMARGKNRKERGARKSKGKEEQGQGRARAGKRMQV
jgi:hypothetical protein